MESDPYAAPDQNTEQNAPQSEEQDYYGLPKPGQQPVYENPADDVSKHRNPVNFKLNIPMPVLLGIVCAAVVIIVLIVVLPRAIHNHRNNSYTDYAAEDTYDEYDMAEDAAEEYQNDDMEYEAAAEDSSSSDFTVRSMDTYGNSSFTFQLPGYWQDYCGYEYMDDYSVYFYHLDSQMENGDGWLFTVMRIPQSEFEYYDNYDYIAEQGDYTYIIGYPSYVAYPDYDDAIANDYHRLLDDASYVMESFTILDSEEDTTLPASEDYIFADSDSRYIDQSELASLSPEELKIARNEIYARHNRLFKDEFLQSYFDSKSWYYGEISPDDFSESVLNAYEKANAALILDYERANGYQ